MFVSLSCRLRGLVSDQSDNHAVEVEEEHDKVESQLEERFLVKFSIFVPRLQQQTAYLLVNIELPEDFGSVEEVGIVNDPCWSKVSQWFRSK